MKEKERNMENWRMGCANILPLTWRFSLGDIVNTTFMGLSQTRKYPCVLLCENELHTSEGLGNRYVRGQMTSRCTHVACAQIVCGSSGRWLRIVWRISGFGRGCNQICPHPPSSLPPSTYSSFPSDSSCVTLDPLCPSSESL